MEKVISLLDSSLKKTGRINLEYRVTVWKDETIYLCYPHRQRPSAEYAKLNSNICLAIASPPRLGQMFVQIIQVHDYKDDFTF